MRPLSDRDDCFHAVNVPDPMWTETTWWGFSVPDRGLGAMVYTIFRPNLNIAALAVQVCDSEAVEPWRSPYARSLWHLRFPDADLNDIQIGPLHLSVVEPLRVYQLDYRDGEAFNLDLRVTGTDQPHTVSTDDAYGHFDQLCRFEGTMRIGAEAITIDSYGMRDRSWCVRDDLRSNRASYTYGAVDDSVHFLVFSRPSDDDAGPVTGGYLYRDGKKAGLTHGRRQVVSRRRGHPDRIEIEAVDELGRALNATGTVDASLASQSTPAMFSWMSFVQWHIGGALGHGEDHDVWSPDRLSRKASDRASRGV